jgi:hypothetical protein
MTFRIPEAGSRRSRPRSRHRPSQMRRTSSWDRRSRSRSPSRLGSLTSWGNKTQIQSRRRRRRKLQTHIRLLEEHWSRGWSSEQTTRNRSKWRWRWCLAREPRRSPSLHMRQKVGRPLRPRLLSQQDPTRQRPRIDTPVREVRVRGTNPVLCMSAPGAGHRGRCSPEPTNLVDAESL